ncbi:uncharacterized protein N7477_002396 [Penicillium maclennaniae]|uniref:uncharacterized protein n=1 Tax=Penicillium maclennaniae TaxID=1343394 RepID=UPI00253FD8A1|nr:uncharacterized protein N7477_002396 [Penicillium maclennaniae]KAJ5676763.1 hypothetical protein N7477_002396 [Penicillium maclennaniae]
MMDSPRRSRNRAACRRCQRRKIRCDGEVPKCTSCKKANTPCVNDGKQEVNRTYIASLQKRMQWLESKIREQGTNVDDGAPLDIMDTSQGDSTILDDEATESAAGAAGAAGTAGTAGAATSGSRHSSTPVQQRQRRPLVDSQNSRAQSKQAHEIGLVSLSSGGEPRYLGPSSGYFLANLVFSNTGRRARLAGNRGNEDEPISLSSELFNHPACLPTRKEDAVELSSKYFASVHLMYPFLHEPSYMQQMNKLYMDGEANTNPAVIFHVFMVLAIAASDLSRRFKIRLPAESYYTAATRYFEGACVEGSLEGLQSLLLLMVYALHNPSCGVNVWSLNYQCLGALIDLGLQRDVRTSSAFPISFLEQEMRTRVFWVVYSFDRTLGTMMGRPIGVRDEACELRLPSNVADIYLTEVAADIVDGSPSHMTYSIHLFRLARVNSEIKYVLHSICRDPPHYAYPPVIDIHQWQKEMIDQLQTWLSEIPHVPGMESIAKIYPSDEILAQCFQHAVDLLRGFGELYHQESLLYSRLIVHSILLATLIMLHCLWRLPDVASHIQIDALVADTSISSNILSSIGEYWIEAKRARDCIHDLSVATIQRLIKARGLDSSISLATPRPGTFSGRNLRSQQANENVTTPDRVDSAIEIAPTMLDDNFFNLDTSTWLNDIMPDGFMDLTGAPDWDSILWGGDIPNLSILRASLDGEVHYKWTDVPTIGENSASTGNIRIAPTFSTYKTNLNYITNSTVSRIKLAISSLIMSNIKMAEVDQKQQMHRINHTDLEEFVRQILIANGTPSQNASIVSKCLVSADLRGVDTHGSNRIPSYMERIRQKCLDPSATPSLRQITPVVAQVDGHNGWGFVAAHKAMSHAIEMAQEFGMGMVSVKHSNHFGMSAWLRFRPGEGKEKLMGVSPIACGAPSGNESRSFILDMAPSVAARGKIYKALRRGEKIPMDWALDGEGKSTDDPAKALQGVMLPMGGTEGVGIVDHDGCVFRGHFLVAIKPDLFMTMDEFKGRMDYLYKRVTESEKADGVEQIFFPGEIEQIMEEQRLTTGIPLAEAEIAGLNKEADLVDVEHLKIQSALI